MKHPLAVAVILGAAAALLAQDAPRPSVASPAGRTYHVSTSGNDTWPGTEEFPWKSLGHVSSITFQPGDRVLLRRGDTWVRERLTLQGSGSYWGAWIGLGAYGPGARPRIMNPPYHPDTTLVDWTVIHDAYHEIDRHQMKLAIEVTGDNWFISGIEISHAEEGILTRGEMGYWFEDLYIHNIGFADDGTPLPEKEGGHLLMPIYPDFEEIFEATGVAPMYDPYPVPAMGSAIEAHGDKVTIRDVVIERATGGISGWVSEGLVEDVFLDQVTMGGLTIGGSDLRVRHATVLNAGWPGQAFAWIGICITMDQGDSSKEVTDSEFAYTGAIDSDSGDEGGLEFDAYVSGLTWARNFIHENAGPAFEFGMGGPNQYIVVEDNVTWANGWRPWRWMPPGSFRPEFCQDACPFNVRRVAIRGNRIHKAYPGQYLNHFFALEQPGDPFQGLANDWRFAEENADYTVSDNEIHEACDHDSPPPIPEPPCRRTNVARMAHVSASSGAETADLAIDGDFGTEWRAARGKPWIELAWDTPQTIDEVWITDTHDLEDWGVSGDLTFDGEVTVHVTGGIQNNGGVRKIMLDAPRTVRSLRYEVTRTVTECPGTHVGLGEIQALEASPVAPVEVMPLVPGVIDFCDRPDAATLLRGVHHGIDWKETDWTTASDSEGGNRYVYVDFPRNGQPGPTWAVRVLALPWGSTLRSFRLSGPAGARVVASQVGQETDAPFTCTDELTTCQTGWSPAGAQSNLVRFWITLPSVVASVDGGVDSPVSPAPGSSAGLNDIHFDDLVVEGGGGR